MFGVDRIGIFPNYKAGMCLFLSYPDTCCLGQQNKKDFAPAHCVLHPDIWPKLRVHLIFIFQGEKPVA